MIQHTFKKQKEHRERLIKALRSGNYKQAKGRLKKYNLGFCVLGVACDVSKLGKWKDSKYNLNSNTVVGYSYSLGDEVRDFYGFRTDMGNFTFYTQFKYIHTSLAKLNDNLTPFNKIADIIEQEPKGLIK